MLLASVKLGSLPALESSIASTVHLFKRLTASAEGSPQSSTLRSIRRPSTVALIITRRYACAESKPSCFALVVNSFRIAGSNGTWIVDVSLITIGYQIGIIMSILKKMLECKSLSPKINSLIFSVYTGMFPKCVYTGALIPSCAK